jgi:membrane fusion protein (multidrug efflux system)
MRALLAAALFCALAPSSFAQQPSSASVPVGIVVATRKPIAKTVDFVGRVNAINKVEVRARVTGYLDDVRFKEGDVVKDGQPLYQIEKDLFQASVDQAAGVLAGDEAKKALTAIQYQRAEDLMKTSAGTVVARDQALTADRAAAAQLMISKANLETAKINLGYTDIASPIAGKIGKTNITKGNVVGPDSGTLTTIVSQDPMYVLFPVSSRDIMRAKEGDHPVSVQGINVNLRFTSGQDYGEVGKINFVDVTVDRSTDTVLVRAVFANPAGALIDGQLVNVALEASKAEEQVVVPQAALLSDQQGIYVFVVDNGKAAIKRIKTSGASGTDAIVSDGLNGGEQIIVDGLQGVREGAAVIAHPATPDLNQG